MSVCGGLACTQQPNLYEWGGGFSMYIATIYLIIEEVEYLFLPPIAYNSGCAYLISFTMQLQVSNQAITYRSHKCTYSSGWSITQVTWVQRRLTWSYVICHVTRLPHYCIPHCPLQIISIRYPAPLLVSAETLLFTPAFLMLFSACLQWQEYVSVSQWQGRCISPVLP